MIQYEMGLMCSRLFRCLAETCVLHGIVWGGCLGAQRHGAACAAVLLHCFTKPARTLSCTTLQAAPPLLLACISTGSRNPITLKHCRTPASLQMSALHPYRVTCEYS